MKNDIASIFEKYKDTTLKIRMLASPLVEESFDDKNYHKVLMENFSKIGKLSIKNDRLLNENLYPLLEDNYILSKQERKSLWDFSNLLLDAYKMENLHVLLRYKIINKLLKDAEKKDDLKEIIKSLDSLVETTFVLMHNASRLTPCDSRAYKYRDLGFEAAYALLEYLEEDKFKNLPDEECKHIVLVNSRYISALFDRSDNYNDKANTHDLNMMIKALELKDNKFYRKQAPNYNWKYHELRTLQYITNFTELCNNRKINKRQLKIIQKYTNQLIKLWHTDEKYYSQYLTKAMLDLYEYRINYLCGDLKIDDYKNKLFEITTSTSQKDFTLHENTAFVLTFAEYLQVVDKDNLLDIDRSRFAYIYQGIISYVHHVPKMQSFSFLLTFLSNILKVYIEIGGREREYENMCLELMAALHPPTYVHVLSVADLTRCITLHLINEEPERFIGFLNCKSVDDVKEKMIEILDFAYHAALCHDFGKLFVAEAIITYDRKLLDEEFDMIKVHPLIGAYILEKHEDTKRYANVARYHHLYYNCKGGYPIENIKKLKEKVIIDITRCADCLDASTDVIGRSYKKGLTIKQIYDELLEGKDTIYAGYVVDLIQKDKVKKDIIEIINKNREVNYHRAYKTLKKSKV